PRPRSTIFVVQPVSESSSPESGDAGGRVSPAGPQLVVPTVVVNESLGPGMVVVVVAGLTVVVVTVVVVGRTVVVVVSPGMCSCTRPFSPIAPGPGRSLTPSTAAFPVGG